MIIIIGPKITLPRDNYRYGLTSTLELLLLVGQYYFSSVIHFTLMKLISIVCIMHTCQTDIRSESFIFILIVTCANIVIFSIRIFSRWYSSARLLDASLITIARLWSRSSVLTTRKGRTEEAIRFSFHVERTFHP